ncbi:MAG: thioredoxin family protein, partial [Nanoarchaeota archaeon]|nr:thioredoxin family protein [Nanoarchaeota archaeon]
ATWSGGRFPQFPVHDQECNEYGIQGSPGLVINGASVSSGRSPAEYLTTICAAFNEVPEGCDAELSAQSFSPGFGYEVGAASEASCG